MSSSDSLTWLKNDDRFLQINFRLARGIQLSEEESIYCLSVAILLIKEFERDKRKTSYLEFGYFLILSYALQSGNFSPLFDLSTNLGFYPVSKFILENGLIDEENLHHHFIGNGLKKFQHKEITETLEQNKYRSQLVESNAKDNCYIAPTSFGKSSMMVELIAQLKLSKIFIIVPTKSLLTQTYKLINSTFTDRKVIFHDEMYGGEERFIAIFTQERALRLLKSEGLMQVDALLVDEAHNLFEASSRSILLSRLIRRVRLRKQDSRIFYFSPLINDSDNLKFEEQQKIETKRIQFNIKEADINEYKLDGNVYKYNRFLNAFFEYETGQEMLPYIFKNSKSNNFFI
ncbi:DEAD/DEAH box helicase [Zobellella sp. DQSA1]|uniref:DEAD/DEAH box helicase n=1 Tax=Zobellella sp. DQSA1 TaxID=3342386 RepID=UPI0035BFE048